jgi:acyl-CoA synthetase (NDP forming)
VGGTATKGFQGFAEAGSVAVVGASERNLLARIALDNLRRWGFAGRVFGIHPRGGPVDGVPTYPSFEEAEGGADVALLAIGAARLEEGLRAAAGAGTRRFVIPGAGANEGGRQIEKPLRAAVQESGAEVLGPNCMGFASLHSGLVPYVGTLDPDLPRGSVGLVSQSGSVCELFTTMPWRVGFSHVISVGNELTVDLTDAVEFLVADPTTEAIGVFVEGVRRPSDFLVALRGAAEAGKPLVALKVGRTEASRAGTVAHTGVLAGDAGVFSAVLREAGVIEAHDVDGFQVLLEMLGKGLERDPGRVLYVGDSGGQANLFADLAADQDVELPPPSQRTCDALRERFPSLGDCENPLDLWALGDPEETYRQGMALLAESEPHLLVLGLDKFLARSEPERAFVRAAVEGVGERGAAVLMAYGGSETADPEILSMAWDRRIPVVRGAERTLASLAALARWRRWRTEPVPEARLPEVLEPDAALVEAAPSSEHAAKRLLESAGIHVTRERVVATADEAVVAGREIGFPVVAKVSGGAHKTEARGVRLDLWTDDAVASAAKDLLRRSGGVLVAEQVRGDVEVIVGAFADEQFGPCGLIGLGGLWTEALGQAAVILGPGSEAMVRRALEPHPWGRLVLKGARGRRFPVDTVIDTALRLIDLITACRDRLSAIEINPLVIAPDRVVAVDALAVPVDPSP